MAGRESQLEKFISDFVLEKTTQRVRLHLDDEITVRPVNLSRTGIDQGWIYDKTTARIYNPPHSAKVHMCWILTTKHR